jgi:chemotaxis signal transduction protein
MSRMDVETPAPPMSWEEVRSKIERILALERESSALKRELLLGSADPGRAAAAKATLYLEFVIGPRRFALPLSQVQEVARMPSLARVGFDHPVVIGLANVHGRPVAVLDLGLMLRDESSGVRAAKSLLVCRVADRLLGLMVDDVEEVATHGAEALVAGEELMTHTCGAVGVLRTERGTALVMDAATIAFSVGLPDPQAPPATEERA